MMNYQYDITGSNKNHIWKWFSKFLEDLYFKWNVPRYLFNWATITNHDNLKALKNNWISEKVKVLFEAILCTNLLSCSFGHDLARTSGNVPTRYQVSERLEISWVIAQTSCEWWIDGQTDESYDNDTPSYMGWGVNSLVPGRFQWNVRKVIFKRISVIDGWGISCEFALRWMPLNLTNDKSTLVQVMAWCHKTTSHYMSQCWPSSMTSYGVTRPH